MSDMTPDSIIERLRDNAERAHAAALGDPDCGHIHEAEAIEWTAAADHIAKVEAGRDAWARMYVSSVDRHHALIASIIRKVNEGGDLGAVVRHVAEHLDNIDALGADADLDRELFDAIARTDPSSLPARLDPEGGER